MRPTDEIPHHKLSLGKRAFLRDLEALVTKHADLIKGARVAVKQNAAGDFVFAVIVPGVPPLSPDRVPTPQK